MIARKFTACLCLLLALPLGVHAQTTYRWVDRAGKVTYSDRPAPPEAQQAEEKRLGAPNSIASGGPDYATRVAAQGSPVTLYASADCGAQCELARDFLKRMHIPHSEKLIKTAEDAAAYKSATGSDNLLVPTLLVGTAIQQGYEDGAWRKLLAAAGYPGAEARPLPR